MPEPAPAPKHNSEKIAVAAASAGAVAAAKSAMRDNEGARKASQPESAQEEPVEMPSPPIGAPAPLAPRPTGPAPGPEGNVYRILMDFTPSMEDELELRAGQVVRMLHEYDDGWVSLNFIQHRVLC